MEPGIIYSAYQFLRIAAEALREASRRECRVWVCGGTGLYIRALVEGLALGDRPRPELRAALRLRLKQQPPREVAAELGLQLSDPDNPVRVVRQAEHACADAGQAERIYEWAGLPADQAEAAGRERDDESALQAELGRWRCAGIAVLDPGRDALRQRISARVEQMFDSGLPEEVARLRQLGYGGTEVVADGIGYREAAAVLDGLCSLPEAIASTITRTRQYAKRQRTYFNGRNWPVRVPPELDRWADDTDSASC